MSIVVALSPMVSLLTFEMSRVSPGMDTPLRSQGTALRESENFEKSMN